MPRSYLGQGVGGKPGKRQDIDKELIPTQELALYLGSSAGELLKFLRSKGLLHKTGRGVGKTPLKWVTPWGAMQAILHFRTLQGKDTPRNRQMWKRWEKAARKGQPL